MPFIKSELHHIAVREYIFQYIWSQREGVCDYLYKVVGVQVAALFDGLLVAGGLSVVGGLAEQGGRVQDKGVLGRRRGLEEEKPTSTTTTFTNTDRTRMVDSNAIHQM